MTTDAQKMLEPSLMPDVVLREARELHRYWLKENKPYSAGVVADCIATIENLLARTASERLPAQRLFDRNAAALALAKKWPGDYAYGDPPEGANDMAFETVDVVVSSTHRGDAT